MAKYKGEFSLKFQFEGEVDPYDPDWIDWSLVKIKLKHDPGFGAPNPDDIAEVWAQSDLYWVDICNAIITALSNGKATL